MASVKKTVVLADVKANPRIKSLINGANKYLEVKGYTEHGLRHVGYVSNTTKNILSELGYDGRMCELGAIAGWMHDIGNSVNRLYHGLTGATLAFEILSKMGMDPDEVGTIMLAIGNHEEDYGVPVNPVSAALILADKSDAHRTRVRRDGFDPDDIHDRVNYAIKKNFVVVDKAKRVIKLVLFMDHSSSLMEYFQIYMPRMALSEQAATFLGCTYELVVNDLVINSHRLPQKPAKLTLESGEKNVSED
ncbi:MAG: phosphohydrolase [Clostridiales bacterium]|nr:phosphohydrolase [Clostridiales bacterium]